MVLMYMQAESAGSHEPCTQPRLARRNRAGNGVAPVGYNPRSATIKVMPPRISTTGTSFIQKLALALTVATLTLATACTRPPVPPDSSPNSQHLPFSGDSQPSVSPGSSLIPFATHLDEGTFLTVRLTMPLSSADAHAGDGFEGSLDEPVIADGQTLVQVGARVSGRVLDAKPSSGPHNPGYLRITLVSILVGNKIVLIDTNSIFTKAAPRRDRAAPDHAPDAGMPTPDASEVVFTPAHRLTFRLAQAADLP